MFNRSDELFSLAKQDIPGGVNSPVRAFNGVGGTPLFIARAEGAHLFDADGNEYVDYVGSWGPMIVGHRHPTVTAAIAEQLTQGVSFGAPTALETALASKIKIALPNVDKVRFVSSGTEAAMSAIRLARGITGRGMILKFEGCYHGHADSLLVKAGSGALTLGVPSSAGVPSELAKLTLTAPYNDLAAVQELFKQFGRDIAAVIVEPIAGNMNCVLPHPEFLSGLRAITREYDSLFIFDEVITGFRVHPGSAQTLFEIAPDLTVLGKVIGGGLPVGAFAGPARFMDFIAPEGPVYQAGTLSGNPLAMASGLATLELISKPGFHAALRTITDALADGLLREARAANIPLAMNRVTGLFGIFFTDQSEVNSFAAVSRCNVERFKQFFHGMLANGVYLAPSAYEAGFVSSAHGTSDIDRTLAAARAVFKTL